MIRILVCDDDALFANELCAHVDMCFRSRSIGVDIQSCSGAEVLMAALEQQAPDLLFLDLSLNEADGYQLAEEIRRRHMDMEIVFVTSFSQRMAEAFPYRPIGFIVKPVTADDIDGVVNRFLQFYWSAGAYYTVNTREQGLRIPLKNIFYFESEGHKILIHTNSREFPIVQTRRLDEIAGELQAHAFVRSHKSFLVRIDSISHIDRSRMRLILKNGVELPISRSCYNQVIEQFIHHKLR